MGLTKSELAGTRFQTAGRCDQFSAAFSQNDEQCYVGIAKGESASLFAPEGLGREQNELHETIGLDAMLAIERETVEK